MLVLFNVPFDFACSTIFYHSKFCSASYLQLGTHTPLLLTVFVCFRSCMTTKHLGHWCMCDLIIKGFTSLLSDCLCSLNQCNVLHKFSDWDLQKFKHKNSFMSHLPALILRKNSVSDYIFQKLLFINCRNRPISYKKGDIIFGDVCNA